MSIKMLTVGAMFVSMLGFVGCSTEVAPEAEQTASSEDALGLVECNPRNPTRACDRGESCFALPVSGRNEASFVCSAGRCDSIRDCGPGYACRLNHCLALERTPWRRIVRNVRADGADRRDDDTDRDDTRNDDARDDNTRR